MIRSKILEGLAREQEYQQSSSYRVREALKSIESGPSYRDFLVVNTSLDSDSEPDTDNPTSSPE